MEQHSLKNHLKNQNNETREGRIKVSFYTDPLCCWSYAFDKHWQLFLDRHGDRIDYHYVMCGMIPDWKTYNDPMNSVSKPIQMGPVWMHASEVTHVKMKYSIWHEDPPASSYPACIAVKTAALQSNESAIKYLSAARESLMQEGRNISKTEVLLDIANNMSPADLDYNQFKTDWNSGAGKDLFRQDLQQARYHGIGRYPTLTFHNEEGKGIIIVGYRPFEVLEDAFKHMAATV